MHCNCSVSVNDQVDLQNCRRVGIVRKNGVRVAKVLNHAAGLSARLIVQPGFYVGELFIHSRSHNFVYMYKSKILKDEILLN